MLRPPPDHDDIVGLIRRLADAAVECIIVGDYRRLKGSSHET